MPWLGHALIWDPTGRLAVAWVGQRSKRLHISLWCSVISPFGYHCFFPTQRTFAYGVLDDVFFVLSLDNYYQDKYIWKDFMLYHIDKYRSSIKGKPGSSGCSAPKPSILLGPAAAPWGSLGHFFIFHHHQGWTWMIVNLDQSEMIVVIWAINLSCCKINLMHMARISFLYLYYYVAHTHMKLNQHRLHCYECRSNNSLSLARTMTPLETMNPMNVLLICFKVLHYCTRYMNQAFIRCATSKCSEIKLVCERGADRWQITSEPYLFLQIVNRLDVQFRTW